MQHIGQVPPVNDSVVAQFLAKWRLTATPQLLRYTDLDYAPAQCHFSAKHMAISKGGRRVHGWALWMFNGEIVADHHSVWQDQDGVLIDVTPPSNGGTEILFVQDDRARISLNGGDILLFNQRTSDAVVHWLRDGDRSDQAIWRCPKDRADVVAYAAKLGIQVSDIGTDDQHG